MNGIQYLCRYRQKILPFTFLSKQMNAVDGLWIYSQELPTSNIGEAEMYCG
jgi:hypothetical protein